MLQTLTVKALDNTTNVVYQLSNAGTNKAIYQDETSDLREPRLITISQSLKGIGAKGSDRHSVNTQHVEMDSESNANVIGVSTTITVPRSDAVSTAAVKEAVAQHLHALGLSGLTDALIAGRMP